MPGSGCSSPYVGKQWGSSEGSDEGAIREQYPTQASSCIARPGSASSTVSINHLHPPFPVHVSLPLKVLGAVPITACSTRALSTAALTTSASECRGRAERLGSRQAHPACRLHRGHECRLRPSKLLLRAPLSPCDPRGRFWVCVGNHKLSPHNTQSLCIFLLLRWLGWRWARWVDAGLRHSFEPVPAGNCGIPRKAAQASHRGRISKIIGEVEPAGTFGLPVNEQLCACKHEPSGTC